MLSLQMMMGLILSLVIIAFGAIFQLDLFLHNSFGVVFFVLFLFQLAMASFAFLCSIPIRKVGCLLAASSKTMLVHMVLHLSTARCEIMMGLVSCMHCTCVFPSYIPSEPVVVEEITEFCATC